MTSTARYLPEPEYGRLVFLHAFLDLPIQKAAPLIGRDPAEIENLLPALGLDGPLNRNGADQMRLALANATSLRATLKPHESYTEWSIRGLQTLGARALTGELTWAQIDALKGMEYRTFARLLDAEILRALRPDV